MSATKRPGMPIVCVDFDGVIHGYSRGWSDGTIYDPPVDGCGEALLRLMCHYRVAIFSSRSRNLRQRWHMKRYVSDMICEAGWDKVDLAVSAWSAQGGKPAEWSPWTAGDVQDTLREVAAQVRWPFFKPPALLTIDDRAVTFAGDWSVFTPRMVRGFRPWTAARK